MTEAKNKDSIITIKELILNIKVWIRYLISKWYYLIIAGILGGIIGALYAKFSKPTYTARTTFVLESGDNSSGGLGQMAGLAALAGVDLGQANGGMFQGDNLFELYKSRKMIEAVLLSPSKSDSSILLIDRYFQMSKTKDIWQKDNPELLKIDFRKSDLGPLLRSRDSILKEVVQNFNKNNLVVDKNDKKSTIIKVDVNSPDEIFSKEFNETLVAKVNEFYIKTKTKRSADNIQILQYKTDSVRSVMNGSITAAAIVIDGTPNLNPTRQAQRIIPTQRSQFSAETNKAILGQLVQNLEMAKVSLMRELPLIQKVDEPVFPLEKKKIGLLKGTVVGSFLFIFFISIFLLLQKLFRNIMS